MLLAAALVVGSSSGQIVVVVPYTTPVPVPALDYCLAPGPGLDNAAGRKRRKKPVSISHDESTNYYSAVATTMTALRRQPAQAPPK